MDWESGFVDADAIREARMTAPDLTDGDFDAWCEIIAARRARARASDARPRQATPQAPFSA